METANRIDGDELTLLELGDIQVTPQAITALQENQADIERFLAWHAHGQWGPINEQQYLNNSMVSINHVGEVRSIYPLPDGKRLVVVTRWNRALTTVLVEGEL